MKYEVKQVAPGIDSYKVGDTVECDPKRRNWLMGKGVKLMPVKKTDDVVKKGRKSSKK